MPPKPKCTREEIAHTAYQLIQRDGIPALTARTLAKQLGTSPSPIFTIFPNMDAVKDAAREIALQEFNNAVSNYADYTPAFKRIGMSVVAYSIREPELFKLVFMQENSSAHSIQDMVPQFGSTVDVCIQLIIRDYHLTQEQATLLFEQLWTFTYGISSLCAMKVCTLSEEEVGYRMGLIFAGMIMLIHSGKTEQIYDMPEKNANGQYHGLDIHQFAFLNQEKTE